MSIAMDRDGERSSQTVKALLSLRELILSGDLRPGERITELSVVDRLRVSRTPVRSALARLEDEGLLEAIPSGGYAVKAFTEREAFEAIEVRGVLEGLGARFAAERGPSPAELEPIKACLKELDALVGQTTGDDDFADYVHLNEAFHDHLSALAGSRTLQRQVERAAALPFASPSGFVMAQSAMPAAHQVMVIAQDQHRCIVEAIENRESARAESLVREHARLAARNLRAALRDKHTMNLVPGFALIRRRSG